MAQTAGILVAFLVWSSLGASVTASNHISTTASFLRVDPVIHEISGPASTLGPFDISPGCTAGRQLLQT